MRQKELRDLLKRKETKLTGAAAVVAIMMVMCIFCFAVLLNLSIFALLGVGVAWAWNALLVPNVAAELPLIEWWQAALGLLGIRALLGFLKN